MERIHSFPPIINKTCKTLILGSIPGEESLRQNQYYAHPRNQFWRIISDIFTESTSKSYEERTALLLEKGIALWDVINSCERKGSLDSSIKSADPNDFTELFNGFPSIERIFFNGQTAAKLFKQHFPQIYRRFEDSADPASEYVILPSTSPAHTMKYILKLQAWQIIANLLEN